MDIRERTHAWQKENIDRIALETQSMFHRNRPSKPASQYADNFCDVRACIPAKYFFFLESSRFLNVKKNLLNHSVSVAITYLERSRSLCSLLSGLLKVTSFLVLSSNLYSEPRASCLLFVCCSSGNVWIDIRDQEIPPVPGCCRHSVIGSW